MSQSMLSLALGARESLLRCGAVIFERGNANQISGYTSGLQDLTELVNQLEVMWCLVGLGVGSQ